MLGEGECMSHIRTATAIRSSLRNLWLPVKHVDSGKVGLDRESVGSSTRISRRRFLKLGGIGLLAASATPLAGCREQNAAASSSPRTLTVAHNLPEEHPVHKALQRFGEEVQRRSGGSLRTDLYGNGVLGSEGDVLEQLERGGVDMAKVSAAALESFASSYQVFSLPYIFDSQEHFYRSMELPEVQELYRSTRDKGYLALTFYDSGARSFYSNRVIREPEDMRGMKIRVQASRTASEIISRLGASPTPMAYGDVYTAIQQGVIDGAENNVTALTSSAHGEVASIYSETQHQRVPDIVLISTDTWDALNNRQKEAVTEATDTSSEYQRKLWQEEVRTARTEAKEDLGVRFVEPNREAFKNELEPMIEEYRRRDPTIRRITDAIESLKVESEEETADG